MKKYHRIIWGLIAAATLLLLAACGGRTPADSGAVKDDGKGKPAAQTEAADGGGGEVSDGTGTMQYAGAPIDKFEAVDLGGRTLRFQFYFANGRAESTMPDAARPNLSDDGVTESHIMIWENNRRIAEKYNVNMEFMRVPWGDHQDLFITSVMANDPAYDIFGMDNQYALASTSKGFVLSFDDYMPEDADIVNEQKYTLNGGSLMGKEYFFDFKRPFYDAPILGVNLDIIEAIGAENPVDIYDRGEWTWDAFLEICKLATRDIDGDGEIDQWGYGGAVQFNAQCLIASNSGAIMDTETVTQRLDSPNTMEALQFLGELYTVHKVAYSTFASTTTYDDNHDYNGNIRQFLKGDVCFFTHVAWLLPNGEDRLPYNFTVVPHPKGPSSVDDCTYLRGIGGNCIPKGVKDPTVVYQIFEEMQYWWGDDYSLAEEGITDYAFQKYYDIDDWYRSRYNDENNGRLDLVNTIELAEISAVAVPIIRGEMTVSQSVEANKGSIEYKVRMGLPEEQ